MRNFMPFFFLIPYDRLRENKNKKKGKKGKEKEDKIEYNLLVEKTLLDGWGVWERTRRTFIVANMESAMSTMLEGALE